MMHKWHLFLKLCVILRVGVQFTYSTSLCGNSRIQSINIHMYIPYHAHLEQTDMTSI